MASLTQISITSRKAIRYGIYFLILLMIARFTIRTGISIYKRLFPKPPPPPTVTFGKLSKLPFPHEEKPKDVSYRLETPEGDLPAFIEQLPVFFMPATNYGIKGLDIAKEIASELGFNPEGKLIDEDIPNVYTFDKKGSPSVLTINIVNGAFSISYDLNADPSVLGKIPPQPDQAISYAKNYLLSANSFPEELSGPTKTQFLKLSGGKLNEVISLSEADFIKVSFFRKGVNFREIEFPSITPSYPQANVWMIISSSGFRGGNIIAGEYHYFPVDWAKMGTYPILTSQQAWEKLQKGDAFFASFNPNQKEIVVRRVYLAYYDAGQYTQFYQPVVVFEGDEGFLAYVPAVTDEYYGAEANLSSQPEKNK